MTGPASDDDQTPGQGWPVVPGPRSGPVTSWRQAWHDGDPVQRAALVVGLLLGSLGFIVLSVLIGWILLVILVATIDAIDALV